MLILNVKSLFKVIVPLNCSSARNFCPGVLFFKDYVELGSKLLTVKLDPFYRFTFIRSDMTPARAIQQSPSSFLEDSSTSSMEADPERDQRRYLNRFNCSAI